MDQNPANLDLSSSQRAYMHEAVPAEDGANRTNISNGLGDRPTFDGHWSVPTRGLNSGTGYSPPIIHTYPTACLSGNVYDAPTGFYGPLSGWQNPFNAIGINDHGHIDHLGNMPASALDAVGGGTFTQGFDLSSIASHEPYFYGYRQPMPAAPPMNHAVDQTSNTFNNTGPVLARPTCMECGRDFGRQSDLNRHMKKHQPDARVFRCQVHGCQYSSIREDKLKEHSRRPH